MWAFVWSLDSGGCKCTLLLMQMNNKGISRGFGHQQYRGNSPEFPDITIRTLHLTSLIYRYAHGGCQKVCDQDSPLLNKGWATLTCVSEKEYKIKGGFSEIKTLAALCITYIIMGFFLVWQDVLKIKICQNQYFQLNTRKIETYLPP